MLLLLRREIRKDLDTLLETTVHTTGLLTPTEVLSREILTFSDPHRRKVSFQLLKSPVHASVSARQHKTTEILLSYQSDVEAADSDQHTFLHLAVDSISLDVINIVLFYSANMEARSRHGSLQR